MPLDFDKFEPLTAPPPSGLNFDSFIPVDKTHGASGSWGPTAGEQALGRFAKGVVGGVAGPLESIGIAATGLARKFGDPILQQDEYKVEDRPTYQLGKYLRRKTAELLPVDETRPSTFIGDVLPEGAGSMVAFMAGGLAGKVAKAGGAATVAALGAGSQAADAFAEAKEKGASDDDAFKVFAINAGLGTTEAVPIGGWLARLNKASGNKLTAAIREGSEEAIQEIFQQFGSNLTAQKYYDPERTWDQALGISGAAGFTLGSLMSLVVSAIGGRRARISQPKEGVQDAPEIRPVEESRQQQYPQTPSRRIPAEASSRDLVVQGGEVAQETPQAVAPVLAPTETVQQSFAKAEQEVDARRRSYRDATSILPDGFQIGDWTKMTVAGDVMWVNQKTGMGTADVLVEAGQKAVDAALDRFQKQSLAPTPAPVEAKAPALPVAEPPPGKVETLPPAPPQPVTQPAPVPPPPQTPKKAPPSAPAQRAEMPFDIIRAIKEGGFGKLSLGYARTIQKGFKPEGVARDVFTRQGGHNLDDMLDSLHRQGLFLRITDEQDFLDAINGVKGQRAAFRNQATRERKLARREVADLKEFSDIAIKNKRPKGKEADAVAVDDLLTGDAFKVDGEDFVVKELVFDPETQELTHIIAQDGKRFGVKIIAGQQTLYADKGSIVQHEPSTEFLDPQEQAQLEQMLGMPIKQAPVQPGPLPKLRPGEKQGDVFATQTEDLALVGEKGKDFERIQREAAEAAKRKAEAEAANIAAHKDLFGPLSAATVPTSNVPTLVDSQPLIDRALSEGGGDAALKALVPNVRIRYGPLPAGVPGQYEGGVITISKPVMDFIATRFPAEAQGYINKIIAEELTHAVADTVLTPADYIAIAEAMSEQDRQEMLTERPDVAAIFNRTEQLRQLGGEYFAKRILSENEQSRPIDPNSTFGQRILAALQKIWDYLVAAAKRLASRNTVIENALRKVRKAKADILAGKMPVFDQNEPLNAKAIKEALALFEENPAAKRELGLAQAGEVIAASPVAQEALADLKIKAGISKHTLATYPEQASQLRFARDVAARVLRVPFIRKNLVTQSEHFQAATNALQGDLETFERLKATEGVTPEELGTAAANAFETLQMFEASKADLFDAIAKKRPAILREIAKTFEAETEALHNRDVYQVLFKDFQELGRLLMRVQKDKAVLSAYKQATDNKPATRNVIRFIHDNMDFSGMEQDDLRSVDDLWERLRKTIIEKSGKFPAWNGSNVEQVVGASESVIRSVLRIIALSEPIRTELEQAKLVAEGVKYSAPLDRIKSQLADKLKAGQINGALALYEKGIVDKGIGLKESRDAVNFYAKNTRRLMVNLKAMDAAKEIAERLANDPELIRQANDVYKFHNIARITFGTPKTGRNKGSATTLAFRRIDPGDEPIEIEFGNSTLEHDKLVSRAKTVASEYQAYIANPDAPGYDPRLAAGMEKSMDLLNRFLDPSQDPKVRGRLVPSFPVKAWDWFSAKLGHFATIPKYITSGTTGHLADVVDLTRTAYSTVSELGNLIRIRHKSELDNKLKAAMESHGDMVPGQYHLKILNYLAASRQNFNNPSILKPGDAIGNGEVITAEDLAYLRAERAFEKALFDMQGSVGEKQFASVKAMFVGILFDKNNQVRNPITHGPDMTGRDFPPVMQEWSKDWFAKPAKENRIALLDFWKDPLLLGYVLDTRNVDWKFGYAYPEITREIARDLKSGDAEPLANFEDLVTRIFDHYNAQEGVDPKDMAEIESDVLADFDRIFTKLRPIVAQGGENPKTDAEIIGGDNSFNTPRSATVMPPSWYNYGVVTAGDRAGAVRAATLAFQLAHLKAVRALRDSLAAVVNRFAAERQATGISESAQRRASAKQAASGDILYGLGQAEQLLQGVDNFLAHLEIIMKRSANPYVKDSVHMAAMRGGAQLVITSIVSGPAAVTKNIGGGYQNLAMFDILLRRQNVLLSLASRAGELVSQVLKEFTYLVTHTGNPATASLRKLLEKAENVAVIGQVAKAFMGYANQQRDAYVDAMKAGVNYNIDLWETTKAKWKYSRTLGEPRANDPPWYLAAANQLSLMGNTLAQGIGQASVGYADVRLNTRMIAAALPIEQHYRNLAILYGDKIEASGLFPDKVLGLAIWGNDLAAARIRDFFRKSGVGSIDGIMADFYRRWTDARAKERAQGLPQDSLASKIEFFTDPQFNQLEQALTEGNNATYANRPTFFEQSEAHAKLAPLWGYPTEFIRKLLGLLDGLSNKGWFKNLVGNLPMLIQIGIAISLIATLGYGAASFLKRFFENKVTGFPTVFDAQNPKQAAQAILAATADSVPFIGTVANMVTGAGYRTGFDINSQFLALNVIGDTMRTYKEVMQSGDIGGPMQRMISRYVFPLNVVGAHLPNVSGLREFSNTKNILVMGARGTGLETKLRRTGGSGSDANYSASTPIINEAMNALGKGDTAGFDSAYRKLVEQKRADGSLNPAASALTALRGRSPLTSVFGVKPTQQELDQVYANVSPALADRARTTLARFDAAIAGLPRTGRTTARTTGRSRLRASSGASFRLRRPRLRLRMPRLLPPRLRRLAA